MKKTQENKLSMYLFVEKTCKDYSKVWGDLEAFKNAFDMFRDVISDINKQRQIQEANFTGLTKKRTEIKNDLIEMSVQVTSSLKAYALMVNDTELYNKIAYTKNDFLVSRDTILYDRCMLIYNNALRHTNNLVIYGINEENLLLYKADIENYRESINGSRDAISKKKMATQQLRQLFVKGDKLLKGQLDNLMHVFKYQNDLFYNAYKDSRKILHVGIRHKRDDMAA